jgi:hypothetical protein
MCELERVRRDISTKVKRRMATCDLREMSDMNADLTESLEMLKNFEMRVNNHGSFTMLAAIRRASSLVTRLAAARRPGTSS